MENPPVKRFGRYEIVGELGRGAMGVVYQARDPQIDRTVALKTVSLRGQEPEEETEFRRRFQNEAQAAGRLHHPGIVSVFDVGEEAESNEPYIVLEYVAGEALNKILAREKKLPPARALKLAEEVADALEYAHGQGVIHRDIKPGNILITKDGRAKIADFGIAKLNLAHFTLPGKVLGTPAYMAPEQLAGEGADGRADLFSLGVILYLMVTGHSPFQGNSATTVCFKVANRDPLPASALELTLPPELDLVIARAMAKNPDERYQTGAEFARDLRELQTVFKPGSTTTSLASVSANGTKATSLGKLDGNPIVGAAYAVELVRRVLKKAPLRDLILGAATIVMLVIVGVQSKLLIWTHDEAADPGQIRAEQLRATQAQAPGIPVTTVDTTPPPKPATRKAARKTPAKTVQKQAGTPPVTVVVVPTCAVELAIRHQFKDATLTVWVDDGVALTRALHGGAQKRLVVFNGVRGVESETLKVPAGRHTLRFSAQTADQTVSLSKTISADFVGGNDRTLQISFDKHNSAMKLDWQ
ncbi:MAG TPA: serine/threonine-protein kinase [Candidatus Solibacter sp.]|nr:serine/threonine-protein kinase [Candidatus Solibacter sp.]